MSLNTVGFAIGGIKLTNTSLSLDHATIVQNIVGQSKTRVLSANSSAIDLAITGCCQFPVGQVVQRGFQRIVAFVSGAYEFGAGNTT